jgi:hypothetical protein
MKVASGLCTAAALAALLPVAAVAQLKSQPVSVGSGPLRELSTNAGYGSAATSNRGGTVGEGSLGTLSGNSVAGSITGPLTAGPISDINAGPVTSRQPVSGGGTLSDAKAGAVTKDVDEPLRVAPQLPVAELVSDLRPLQEELRAIRPLPPEDESQADAGEAAPEEDDTVDDAIAQNYTDVPEVPPVRPPDAHDPSVVGDPQEAQPEEPRVEQPPAPKVGDPSEAVPIEVEGGEPQQ